MRKTFFSFHYERDSWRAGQVRNCNMIPSEDRYGFIDSVDWEKVKSQGDDAINRWINEQLKYTSTSAVLIGSETADRYWVQQEIIKSWNRGNGIVGIWIHNVKDCDGNADISGDSPFDRFKLADGTLLSRIAKVYDWILDDGRNNIGKWLEEAATIRAQYPAESKLIYVLPARYETAKAGATSASVSGFVPRSPWCPQHGDE